MQCTQCGAQARGRFCASCGASLENIACPGCGADIPPGTRFCTSCGSPARAGSGRAGGGGATAVAPPSPGRGSDLGWWVAGGLLTVILVAGSIMLFLGDSGAESATGDPGGTAGPGLGPTSNVDLSSMTPRQAADRLFDRVMRAVESGNTEEATSFLPMAIQAYDLARPLDADGIFHLALLQAAGGDFSASLETAREGLEEDPEHLLILSAAAQAAQESGDVDAAQEYATLILDAWDREMALQREEYNIHATLLPLVREDAELLLSEGVR